jgi:hypothetical protein
MLNPNLKFIYRSWDLANNLQCRHAMADLKKGLLENVSEVEENMVLTENLETQEGCER